MSAKPWIEAHRREALRRTYEIAAEMQPYEAAWLTQGAESYAKNEVAWRNNLSDENSAALSVGRIDREVRRVRALAEGRLVRETTWRVEYPTGNNDRSVWTNLADAREEAKPNKWRVAARVVRVTRIRRAR